MIRFFDSMKSVEEYDNSSEKCLIMDETIWQRGREYSVGQEERKVFPVLDCNNQIICFAWQDEEANREIRMLRELQKHGDAITFHDLYPDCVRVTIHGCNELAWYMRDYLIKTGISVSVEGKFWAEFGIQEEKYDIPAYQNYEIWAEGVYQKSNDWKQERLRSVSVEFECIDEIYEANIKAGKISDSDMDVRELLEKLRQEKEIIIRGTGTKAQDIYDWLLANGITACAFQLVRKQEERRKLFGKPVLERAEIEQRYKEAVILEGAAKRSSWGFGEVDAYDYEGYLRNKRYFLLKDYIETPENNLMHVFKEKTMILTGDSRLCNRVYRWCRQHGVEHERIYYWNVLGDAETKTLKMPIVSEMQQVENNTVMLVLPGYSYNSGYYLTKSAMNRRSIYLDKFREYGIVDWSDYFSDVIKCIHLETESLKFHKAGLRPAGILLGAIPEFSGNMLLRQCLSGHPRIIMIEDYSAFNNELYYICIRLAEEKAKDILSAFWSLYQEEIRDEGMVSAFGGKDKTKFDKKMKELLATGESFSSQELFVMFHLAYIAMYDEEVDDLEETIVYWEPHWWNREYVREWGHWLNSEKIRNYVLNTVRNCFSCSGSYLKSLRAYSWEQKKHAHIFWRYKKKKSILDKECEYTVKFEDLKSEPKEVFLHICEWLKIPFADSLLETTAHGKTAFYDGVITGFDMKPVYNLYEEFFSAFDRMRICMINASFQKEHGYSYVKCLDFSRRELQEMFLQDFRWEQPFGVADGRTVDRIYEVQKYSRKRLWLERCAEVMEDVAYED